MKAQLSQEKEEGFSYRDRPIKEIIFLLTSECNG